VTVDAGVNPVPVIVTVVPPDVGPELGLSVVTVGPAGATYVNPLAMVAVAVPTVTTTSTVPAARGPVTAWMVVVPRTRTPVAATPPMVTVGVPLKLVPRIVMSVPPAVEPVDGEIDATVGPGVAGGVGDVGLSEHAPAAKAVRSTSRHPVVRNAARRSRDMDIERQIPG